MTTQVLWLEWSWGELYLIYATNICAVSLGPMDTQSFPFCNGFSDLGWVDVTLPCPMNFPIQIVVTVATVRKYSKCGLTQWNNEEKYWWVRLIKAYLRPPVWDGFYNFIIVNSVMGLGIPRPQQKTSTHFLDCSSVPWNDNFLFLQDS